MKLHPAEVHLETFGVEEEIDMGIEPSAKAFRALIDSQYSDKPGSIVRELCTNAWDAHAAVRNKAPFFVFCPNELRPEFYVRDYGVGMTHEKIKSVYSKLFLSDKINTNRQHGQWGLGSKTPLAYADSFTLQAYDGPVDGKPGTVRNYELVIRENGKPGILFHGAEPCDEPTGIRVGLAVEAKDFEAFKKAIRYTAFGFDPGFESNLPDLKSFAESKPLLKGNGWRAFPSEGWGLSSPTSFYIRQGQVIYPLNNTNGLEIPSDSSRRYLIDVPIGAIEVTTSREAIQYTEGTTRTISARLELIKHQVAEVVNAEIKDIPTIADFVTTLAKIKPGWMTQTFIHEPSGLSEARVSFEGLTGVFKATCDHNERWAYDFYGHKSFTAQNGRGEHFFMIPDISELFDKERPTVHEDDLTPTERRRLARLTRIYAETRGLESASFMIGVEWTDKFWAATIPLATREIVTVADLKAAVPRRRAEKAAAPKPLRAIIRGLALAKSPTDQLPMAEMPEDLSNHAWIGAEEWRRNRDEMWTVAQKFNAPALLIVAAPSRKLLADTGVPHLREWVAAKIKAAGQDPETIVDLASYLDSYTRPYFYLAKRMLFEQPNLVRRIVLGTGLFTTAFKELRPLAQLEITLGLGGKITMPDFTAPMNSGLSVLLPPKALKGKDKSPAGKLRSLCSASHSTRVSAVMRTMGANDPLEAIIDVILLTQKHFPSLIGDTADGFARKAPRIKRLPADDHIPF